MEVKLFEVRDRGTFIPVMAVRLRAVEGSQEQYLLRRVGYFGTHHVVVTRLSDNQSNADPFAWPHNRTMKVAHVQIEQQWADLTTGDVIDVEYLLKETPAPKRSERLEGY